jgi:hypothetical protein
MIEIKNRFIKEKAMFRQGDLLFTEVSEIPSENKRDDSKIIAQGEATGHHHRLRNGKGRLLLWAAGIAYIKNTYKAFIDHEEHKTITLPPGQWQVIRQREYEPAGWRQVND